MCILQFFTPSLCNWLDSLSPKLYNGDRRAFRAFGLRFHLDTVAIFSLPAVPFVLFSVCTSDYYSVPIYDLCSGPGFEVER